MVKLSNFKTDAAAIVDGRWFDFADGIRLKIAKWQNPEFKKFLEKLSRPHLRQFRTKGRVGDLWQGLVNQAAARHVLLDWENIDGENGKPLKYTEEEGIKLFSDPTLQTISDFIIETSVDDANFYAEDMKDAEKN